MNLLFFTSQYPFDGGEAFVEDEINEIARHFEHITVFTYAKSQNRIRKVPQNAEIIRTRDKETPAIKIAAFLRLFSSKTFGELAFLRRGLKQKIDFQKIHYIYMYYKEEEIIRSLLIDYDFSSDLCYSYWFGSRSYALSQLKQLHPEIKYVCRAHRVDSIPTNYNPFRREILSNIDCIFPISETAKGEIEETERLSGLNHRVKIYVSRLGIKKEDSELNIIKDPYLFRIVSCSSIIPRKRLDLVIKAIAGIQEGNRRIEWVHFGDGSERAEIETMAKRELGTRNDVTYTFKGNTDKKLILYYYRAEQVDVFINTSDSEGVPVSIMEAMSYGIPCISRNVGGNAEIIEHGVNGFIIESEDPLEISTMLMRIQNMPDSEGQSMRESAYKTYRTVYNAEANYNNHALLLKEIFEG